MGNIEIYRSYDFDNLIKEVYNVPYYSFQQQDGCKSRGRKTYNIKPFKDLYPTEIEELINGPEQGINFEVWKISAPRIEEKDWPEYKKRLWLERNFYPHPRTLIWDLYEKGYIKEMKIRIIID